MLKLCQSQKRSKRKAALVPSTEEMNKEGEPHTDIFVKEAKAILVRTVEAKKEFS